MQVRDKKTLGIDTIFPVLLILVGLALSTISFIKDGPSRDMTPFIYPSPLKMYYNKNSAIIKDPLQFQQITDFMINDWKGMNASSINLEDSY